MQIVPKDQIVTPKHMFSNDGFLITWGYVFYEYLISLAYGAVDMTGGSLDRQWPGNELLLSPKLLCHCILWQVQVDCMFVSLPMYINYGTEAE